MEDQLVSLTHPLLPPIIRDRVEEVAVGVEAVSRVTVAEERGPREVEEVWVDTSTGEEGPDTSRGGEAKEERGTTSSELPNLCSRRA